MDGRRPEDDNVRRWTGGSRRYIIAGLARVLVIVGAAASLSMIPEKKNMLIIPGEESSQPEGSVSTETSSSSTARKESPAPASVSELAKRARKALAGLGPSRVTATQTSKYSEAGRQGSDTTTVEQLLDQERHLGLQLATRLRGELEKESLDGREMTTYKSSPVVYGKHVYLEPPAGLPFPIPGDYEETLKRALEAEFEALPEGGWRLSLRDRSPPADEVDAGERLPIDDGPCGL